MENAKTKTNFFVRLKNWIVKLAKDYWHLNWEAKIGILFLIPPVWGAFIFILDILGAEIGFNTFPSSWNYISGYDWYDSGSYGYAATPAIPLYLGLMAIAGAYLIKGNLKKKE